jgi:hypothetical protein
MRMPTALFTLAAAISMTRITTPDAVNRARERNSLALHLTISIYDRRLVVPAGGLVRGLRRGPVGEVDLTQFAHGRPIWVRVDASRWFDREEVCRRARSRIGEDRYHLLTNNCEHFCEWCVRGEHRSYQVDEFVSRPWRLLQRSIDVVAHALNRRRGARPATYSIVNQSASN